MLLIAASIYSQHYYQRGQLPVLADRVILPSTIKDSSSKSPADLG
jgi:hypothetical protein